jgi:hypothetical protein
MEVGALDKAFCPSLSMSSSRMQRTSWGIQCLAASAAKHSSPCEERLYGEATLRRFSGKLPAIRCPPVSGMLGAPTVSSPRSDLSYGETPGVVFLSEGLPAKLLQNPSTEPQVACLSTEESISGISAYTSSTYNTHISRVTHLLREAQAQQRHSPRPWSSPWLEDANGLAHVTTTFREGDRKLNSVGKDTFGSPLSHLRVAETSSNQSWVNNNARNEYSSRPSRRDFVGSNLVQALSYYHGESNRWRGKWSGDMLVEDKLAKI